MSKKLTPASLAASRHSAACLAVSIWLALAKVTQLPRESTLTWRPERPNRRYSISAMGSPSCSTVRAAVVSAAGLRGTSGHSLEGDRARILRSLHHHDDTGDRRSDDEQDCQFEERLENAHEESG